jgi:hypothetical protein
LKKFIEGTQGGRKWDEGSAYIELLRDETVKRDWTTVIAIQPSVIKTKFGTWNQLRKTELAKAAKNSSSTSTTTAATMTASSSLPTASTTKSKNPSTTKMKEALREANESIPAKQPKWKLSGTKEEILARFTRLKSNQSPEKKAKSKILSSSNPTVDVELPEVDGIPLVESHEAIIGLVADIGEEDQSNGEEDEVEYEV